LEQQVLLVIPVAQLEPKAQLERKATKEKQEQLDLKVLKAQQDRREQLAVRFLRCGIAAQHMH
jgi:hypothetical protein